MKTKVRLHFLATPEIIPIHNMVGGFKYWAHIITTSTMGVITNSDISIYCILSFYTMSFPVWHNLIHSHTQKIFLLQIKTLNKTICTYSLYKPNMLISSCDIIHFYKLNIPRGLRNTYMYLHIPFSKPLFILGLIYIMLSDSYWEPYNSPHFPFQYH